MEVYGTLEKDLEFSGTFCYMSKEALRERRVEKLVDFSRINGFVLYLAYDIIVLS